jgi:hypothetical protein
VLGSHILSLHEQFRPAGGHAQKADRQRARDDGRQGAPRRNRVLRLLGRRTAHETVSGLSNGPDSYRAAWQELDSAIAAYPDRFIGFGKVNLDLPAQEIAADIEREVVGCGFRGIGEPAHSLGWGDGAACANRKALAKVLGSHPAGERSVGVPRGIVKWLSPEKGCGVIARTGGEPDAIVEVFGHPGVLSGPWPGDGR